MLEIILMLFILLIIAAICYLGCVACKLIIWLEFGETVAFVTQVGFYIVGISAMILSTNSIIPFTYDGQTYHFVTPFTIMIAFFTLIGIIAFICIVILGTYLMIHTYRGRKKIKKLLLDKAEVN